MKGNSPKLQAYKILGCLKECVEFDRKSQSKRLYAAVKSLQSQELDWHVNVMGVMKETGPQGLRKGDKVFNPGKDGKPSWDDLKNMGYRTREIKFWNKNTRKAAAKALAKTLDIPCPWQHGFTANQGLKDAWIPIDKAESVLLVDLENAFDQISQEQAYWLFRVVFDLNRRDSNWLAQKMCYKGYVFQGNPIAPLIFNLLSCTIGWRLKRANINCSQYADDLAILGKHEYMGYRLSKFVLELIRQEGWIVNPRKVTRQRKGSFESLGLHQYQNKTKCQSHRKLKKKIKLFHRVLQKAYGEVTYEKWLEMKKVFKVLSPKDIELFGIWAGLLGWEKYPDKWIMNCPPCTNKRSKVDYSEKKKNRWHNIVLT